MFVWGGGPQGEGELRRGYSLRYLSLESVKGVEGQKIYFFKSFTWGYIVS